MVCIFMNQLTGCFVFLQPIQASLGRSSYTFSSVSFADSRSTYTFLWCLVWLSRSIFNEILADQNPGLGLCQDGRSSFTFVWVS